MATSTNEVERLGRVQSLVRAFGLLDALAETEQGLSLNALSKEVKLPFSTTHRLLSTMSDLGYANFDAQSGRWSVGMRAYAVGRAFTQQRDIARIARPTMQALMLEARATTSIAALRDDRVVCLGHIEGPVATHRAPSRDQELPIHATALGKVLAAFLRGDDFTAFFRKLSLPAMTPHSITDLAAFFSALRQVPERGFATDDQEYRVRLRCVAAPIFDESGRVAAAISVSGDLDRITPTRIEPLSHAVKEAASRVTLAIGGRLPA